MRRRRPRARPRRDPGDLLVGAARVGDAAAVRRILARGVGPDRRSRDGTTPLYAAAVQGHAPVVRLLLATGADPDRESTAATEGLPLCAAVAHDHADAIDALLVGGADPNRHEHDPLGATTALHAAAALGRLRTVERLLAAGADPLLSDSAGTTPLDLARHRAEG